LIQAVPMKLQTVGKLSSKLRSLRDAPKQGGEGAPDAWLTIAPKFQQALRGIQAGDELLLLTWLHRAQREVLQVHPRGDPRNPLTGVFATRSPHRPNPIGLHPVTVREVRGRKLLVGPIETIDGTPVVDVKPVL
jgi:tRNA-Thr(GGU) m(6)t(6)A37 methyltransferase TsaA